MCVGKLHSFLRQLIHVRSGNFAALGVVGMHISITHVVGKNEDDIWRCLCSRECSGDEKGCRKGKSDEMIHIDLKESFRTIDSSGQRTDGGWFETGGGIRLWFKFQLSPSASIQSIEP